MKENLPLSRSPYTESGYGEPEIELIPITDTIRTSDTQAGGNAPSDGGGMGDGFEENDGLPDTPPI